LSTTMSEISHEVIDILEI